MIVISRPQPVQVTVTVSLTSGGSNGVQASQSEHLIRAVTGCPTKLARRSASVPMPTAARRSSTPSGSLRLSATHRPPRLVIWVPYTCCPPSCSSTRSVRNAWSVTDASPASTAAVSRPRQCRMNGMSAVACWTISHIACAPSTPTRELPGQPRSATTCLSQGRFSASTSRIASESYARRAAWSFSTLRSSSARSASSMPLTVSARVCGLRRSTGMTGSPRRHRRPAAIPQRAPDRAPPGRCPRRTAPPARGCGR